MNISQVLDKKDLDILQEKFAKFEKLKSVFSGKNIESLKKGLDLKNAIGLLASGKDGFAGYASGHEDDTFQNLLSLGELFVDPKHQGKGIGTTLLNNLIAKAKEKGLEGLVAKAEPKNKPAQGLFEKLGFAKLDGKEIAKEITYRLLFGDK